MSLRTMHMLLPTVALIFLLSAGGLAIAAEQETFSTPTSDGWKIALTHLKPASGVQAHPYPVVLCHGFRYNANFRMLDDRANLPVYLANLGYDVWVPSLRGSGKSSKWMFKLMEVGGQAAGLALGSNPADDPVGFLFGAAKVVRGIGQAEMNNASPDPKYMNWTFDDYALKDVPAIIRFVKEKTRKDKVHWVGHSMGGNILLCYLTQKPQANKEISSIFTAGSQLTMAKGTVMRRQLENLQALRLLEMRGNAGDLATAGEMTKETNNKMFFNLDNGDPHIVERLNTIGLDTPAMGVLDQYMTLSDTGRYSSADKKVDYTGATGNISAPFFFSAGKKDNFVSPEELDFLMKNVSSKIKDSRIYGRAEGFGVDYGHNDAFISPAAGQEIYPLVAQWLSASEGGTDTGVGTGAAKGPTLKRAGESLEY